MAYKVATQLAVPFQLATKEQPARKRLHKYFRDPANLPNREITDRSLDIIQTIERYRLLPTSLLLRLIPGNVRITYRHLQTLYHRELINRFTLPRFGNPGPFIYYIDNKEALRLLMNYRDIEKSALDWDAIESHQKSAYSDINKPGHDPEEIQGRLPFVTHELGITRFHATIELACRELNGEVILKTWKQGSELYNYVYPPRYASRLFKSDNGHLVERYGELGETQRIPHRPDGFLTLAFPTRPDEPESHFMYERDRKTMDREKMAHKLRGHYHFIVKEHRNQQTPYNAKRIRAVLVETIDDAWKQKLWQTAHRKIVSPNPSSLFWFASSKYLTEPVPTIVNNQPGTLPRYLANPLAIFGRLWQPVGEREQFSLVDL